jgi:hypothetical protein
MYKVRKLKIDCERTKFSGASSFGSFNTYISIVDGNKSKRILYTLEHENIFSTCSWRYGKVFGTSE